jgi:hypothetical protein
VALALEVKNCLHLQGLLVFEPHGMTYRLLLRLIKMFLGDMSNSDIRVLKVLMWRYLWATLRATNSWDISVKTCWGWIRKKDVLAGAKQTIYSIVEGLKDLYLWLLHQAATRSY